MKYLSVNNQICDVKCESGTCMQPNFKCLTNTIGDCTSCSLGGTTCYKCEDNKYLHSDGSTCSDGCPETECA